jgi:hypothetical protein
MCDVVEINIFFIHDIQSAVNPLALMTSNKYSQDKVSKAFAKSILKKDREDMIFV